MHSNWFVWLILLVVIGPMVLSGVVTLAPFVIIAWFIYSMIKHSKDVRPAYERRNTTGMNSRYYSASENARVNVYLRRYFRENTVLQLEGGFSLRLNGKNYLGMRDLNVYENGRFVASLTAFETISVANYGSILKQLLELSKKGYTVHDNGVIDVEVEEHKEEEKPQQQPNPDFIRQIIKLNEDIPDEEISLGLDETVDKLRTIQEMEKHFPASHDKLAKLNQYYLPILIRILTQYRQLQNVKSDPNYEDTRSKLSRTIKLINEAMTTIISGMSDEDFINLSADISTLEAVLQKDGFVNDKKFNMKQDKK